MFAPRERRSHVNDAALHPRLQVRFGVQVIHVRRAAAKEQDRLPNVPPRCFLRRTFFDERPERGEARAGAEHDDGHRGVVREVEGRVGRPDDDGESVAGCKTCEERRRDTVEFQCIASMWNMSRQGWRFEDADRKGKMPRMCEWRRGDGVLPDSHRRNHLKIRGEWQVYVLMIFENVDH